MKGAGWVPPPAGRAGGRECGAARGGGGARFELPHTVCATRVPRGISSAKPLLSSSCWARRGARIYCPAAPLGLS